MNPLERMVRYMTSEETRPELDYMIKSIRTKDGDRHFLIRIGGGACGGFATKERAMERMAELRAKK